MRNYITMCSLLLLAVSTVAITGCKGKKMDEPEKVFGLQSYYELIHEGSNSNHEIKEVIIVNSQEELLAQFAQINSTRKPGLEIPEINFKRETVVFAYGGQQTTGGYFIDIPEIEDEKDLTHFNFELKREKGDMVTMSLTTPFKIIKVKHDDKKITASF
ncbi:MAG: protease complex subunit PrcB family protein [Nonlabens sp.]|uniref:protease complex subunit PrcB family protein n=1 Tax=Nonlabens sp. TaxID=1888209 RepID=UPI003EF21BEA